MKYIVAVLFACIATQQALPFNPDKLNKIVQEGTYEEYAQYMKKLNINVDELSSKESAEGLQKLAQTAGNTKNQLIVALDVAQRTAETKQEIKEHKVTEYAEGAGEIVGGTLLTVSTTKMVSDLCYNGIHQPLDLEKEGLIATAWATLAYTNAPVAVGLLCCATVYAFYKGTTTINDVYHNNESLREKVKIANNLQEITKRIDQCLAKK
ncbi:MAG: hypothetical protein WCE21_05260 [Candidatus Babeliales bacterium]